MTAQLFITYSMMKMGFDFHPINDDMPSKMIH